MIINTSKSIHLKEDIKDIEKIIKNRFERFTWLKFKRLKEVYYRGKPSFILKFGDENSAAFAYYNFSSKISR